MAGLVALSMPWSEAGPRRAYSFLWAAPAGAIETFTLADVQDAERRLRESNCPTHEGGFYVAHVQAMAVRMLRLERRWFGRGIQVGESGYVLRHLDQGEDPGSK